MTKLRWTIEHDNQGKFQTATSPNGGVRFVLAFKRPIKHWELLVIGRGQRADAADIFIFDRENNAKRVARRIAEGEAAPVGGVNYWTEVISPALDAE